jgi:catechol 2,3-dioxygenase-like lactoylglutathione lyase family enzyme
VLTILAVDDVARATAFYRDAFGWPETVAVPIYAELALPGGMRLGLYARDGFARNTGRAPARVPAGHLTATELYLHVDDLDGAIGRLRAAGAAELSPRARRDWGDDAAYFADPDGNVVVVATPARG